MGEHVCAELQHDTDQLLSPGGQTKLIRKICGKMNETASRSHGRKNPSSQCNLSTANPTYCPGTQLEYVQCEAGYYPPEVRHGPTNQPTN